MLIAFDTYGARRRRQFGFEELGGGLSEIPDESDVAVEVATAVASEVPWGAGAQDYILEATIPGSEPVQIGAFDAASTSDRLRSIAEAQGGGLSRDDAITATLGGRFYDPSIRTGTIDWSQVFRDTPGAINTLGAVATTIARTVGTVAGVTRGAPAGNPAPGGRPSPGLIQRFLGGGGSPAQGGGTAPASGLSQLLGGNLVLFAALGLGGYWLLKKAR